MTLKGLLTPLLLLALSALPVCAQDSDGAAHGAANETDIPVYRVNVVARSTQAIDYRHEGNTVKVQMTGTSLMPKAEGRAKVKSHRDRTSIDLYLNHMKPASVFGPEYLTYVLWAITPEGRPVNLGEAQVHLHHDDDSALHTTTPLQAFGLIVTAEPYANVTRPSDLVVAENNITPNLKVNVQPIEAHYKALDRGDYRVNLNPADLPSQNATKNTPLELLEAENAVAIAKAQGADKYAGSSLQKAEDFLNNAKNAYRSDEGSKAVVTAAKSAEETAEDARLISIQKEQQQEEASNREKTQQRLEAARHKAEEARAKAEAQEKAAEQAKLEAQQNEQERLQAEAAQKAAEQAKQQAEVAAQQATLERQQAEAARAQAIAQQQQLQQQEQQARAQAQQAQLQAQRAEQARQQAEAQVQQTRERLTEQLNKVMQTRQTARGVIVNMNDVLFATNKATLRPGARIRLAKIAGIIMAYPDLKLEIDGYTDSTGTAAYNEQLSQERADTVRSFLASQGVPEHNIITHGFGEQDPIASNQTASGRQLNRRVELVVSGNAIGVNAQNQPAQGMPAPNTSGASGAIAGPVGNQPSSNATPQ